MTKFNVLKWDGADFTFYAACMCKNEELHDVVNNWTKDGFIIEYF